MPEAYFTEDIIILQEFLQLQLQLTADYGGGIFPVQGKNSNQGSV